MSLYLLNSKLKNYKSFKLRLFQIIYKKNFYITLIL